MARLHITHRTLYEYACPVSFGRHRLVLRPREGHDLRVVRMQLQITPAHYISWTRDVFGNSIAFVDFEAESERLEIVNEVEMERWPPFPRPPPLTVQVVEYPVVYEAMEMEIARAYLELSFPENGPAIEQWLNGTLTSEVRHDAHAMVLALCAALKTGIRYQRRSEKGVQSPAVTLELRTGSCRDMATLLLEGCRMLGIASRFVSGYLHCAASDAGHASTHAWTEVYLPGHGWCGFDPTIGEPISDKHIAVGVSHHPRGIMPISGRFIGSRADFREMTVQVATRWVED